MKRLEFIDFSKGMAILGVVLLHYIMAFNFPSVLKELAVYGGFAVHVFFFLSGFGLYWGYSGNIKAYYLKRFSRLYIPYALIILMLFIVNIFIDYSDTITISSLFSHLLLYRMFIPSLYESFHYEYWFIATLLQFYILFPFFYARLKRNTQLFIGSSCIISLVWWVTLFFMYRSGVNKYEPLDLLFPRFLWEFSIGMYVADAYQRKVLHFKISFLTASIAFFLSSILSVIITLKLHKGDCINDAFNFVSYLSLTYIIYTIAKNMFKPLIQFVTFIGKYTLPIYLTHIIVVRLYFVIFNIQNYSLVHLPVIFILLVIFVYMFHRLSTMISSAIISS